MDGSTGQNSCSKIDEKKRGVAGAIPSDNWIYADYDIPTEVRTSPTAS